MIAWFRALLKTRPTFVFCDESNCDKMFPRKTAVRRYGLYFCSRDHAENYQSDNSQ